MYIVSTKSAEHVAKGLLKKGLNVAFTDVNKDGMREFPDGELYVRVRDVDKLSGERVVVLHSGQPDANGGLMELYSVLEILNKPLLSSHAGGKKYEYTSLKKPASVEVFFLYFPYGMQDKVFETGECNMAESVVRMLTSYYNVSKIYVMDAHFEGAEWTSKYPLVCVKARDAIGDAMHKDGVLDAVMVAPDLGAQARLDISGFSKKRNNSFDVELSGHESLEGNIKGKTVVVWDDLIETGGTMCRAAESLRKMGAKKVVAAATHGVLLKGVERINGAYSKLYLTNTVDTKYANVDIGGVVLDAVGE
ncbi:MAG: ribose-phosphate pyrophosphokinase [Candidatus Aenigmarchaeota archaeon]|nr:ribose-phosphate pyrophosphokinase [Candidatus Aenigmarchaeota archaeon]